MDVTLFLDMVGRLVVVLCAASVAGLALHRLLASRSINRVLYGAVASLAGVSAIVALADVITGQPTLPIVTLASLLSPLAWAITLWVAWTPRRNLYYSDGVALQPRQDASGMNRRMALEPSQDQDTAPPVFERAKRVPLPHWPMPLTLEFIPGKDPPR